MEGFRYDAHPMGMLCGSVGALSTFYPDANEIKDPDNRHIQTIRLIAKMPTLAAFAYRHSQGQPYVYPDNDLSYAGQLPEHDVQDDRAEVRAGSPAREGARRPVHPPRRPRAERVDERGPRRRLDAGRPVLGARRRRRRALRPAARRRQRGRAADAQAHRDDGEHPGLHQGREGRRRAPDGLRPPRLQELRPAREDHQEGRRGRLRGHRARTRCSTSPPSSRRSRSRTTTSSSASSTRTSTSTRASSTRRSACRSRCSRCMFAIGRTSGWIAQWLELVEDKEQKIARPRQIYTGDRGRDYVPDRPAVASVTATGGSRGSHR